MVTALQEVHIREHYIAMKKSNPQNTQQHGCISDVMVSRSSQTQKGFIRVTFSKRKTNPWCKWGVRMGVSPSGVVTKGIKGFCWLGILWNTCVFDLWKLMELYSWCVHYFMLYLKKYTQWYLYVSEYLRVSPREGAVSPVNTPDMSPKGEVLHHNQAAI